MIGHAEFSCGLRHGAPRAILVSTEVAVDVVHAPYEGHALGIPDFVLAAANTHVVQQGRNGSI